MTVDRMIEIRIKENYDINSIIDIIKWITLTGFIPLKNMDKYHCSYFGDGFEEIIFYKYNDVKNFLILQEKEQNDTKIVLIEKRDNHEIKIPLMIYFNVENKQKFYDLVFTLDDQKRLIQAAKYTDFSFYLNKIIPNIKKHMQIGYIKCKDIDNYS